MKAQLSILAIVCLLLPANAVAQTAEEEVEQLVRTFYQTLTDGDAEGWARHNAVQYHGNFGRSGLVLSPEAATAAVIQESFDAGLDYQLTVRRLSVTVYGDAAVATFYTTGPVTAVNGNVIEGTVRVTQVWIKEVQSWKMAHFHVSPLET